MPGDARPLYAVLIDADNIAAKHAQAILKEITKFGEPALRRVYGDWSKGALANWGQAVRDLGLVAHHEAANTTGKNASDIGLVIDAMDILHSGRFQGFVIVSSDSDFTALANRIREQGLEVIGMGEKKTPESLKSVCNRFILIENIVAGDNEDEADQPHPRENPTKTIPLIRRAMEKLDQDDGWTAASALGSMILRDNSDFDARTYGFKKLGELLKALKEVQTKQVGTQLYARLKD